MSLYALLGVPKDASLDDIDAGYRRACEALPHGRRLGDLFSLRLWRLWQVKRAWRILRDPASRQGYDAVLPMIELLGRHPPGLL